MMMEIEKSNHLIRMMASVLGVWMHAAEGQALMAITSPPGSCESLDGLQTIQNIVAFLTDTGTPKRSRCSGLCLSVLCVVAVNILNR